jgi:hypothetical protein
MVGLAVFTPAAADAVPAFSPASASASASPSPEPSVSCPPAPPVSGALVEVGSDRITFAFRAAVRPPGCATQAVTVEVFGSFADAQLGRDVLGRAVSPVETTSGRLTVTGLTGARQYWYRFSGGGSTFSSLVAGPVLTGSPVGRCTADAVIVRDWGTGFVARVTVSNTGTAAIRGWRASWSWSGGARVEGLWDAVAVAPAPGVSQAAGNAGYNGDVAPGAAVSFGLVASSTSTSLVDVGCVAS